MRLSFKNWRKLWAWFKALRRSFSLPRHAVAQRIETRRRTASHRANRRRRVVRAAVLEHCEPRQMMAADLSVASFSANNHDLVVNYSIADETAVAFDINVYRSSDGTTLDALVGSTRVSNSGDLAVGSGHTTEVTANFNDVASDYVLIAVVDAVNENAESNESNNRATFAGGVFQSVDGTVHVHGSGSADTVSIAETSTLDITFNGGSMVSFPLSGTGVAAEVHVRTQANNDTVTSGSGVSKPIWNFGGAGNDTLGGGAAADFFEGGAGNDSLTGGAGNDTYVFAGSANLGGDTITEAASVDADTLDFSALGAAVNVNVSLTTAQTVATSLLTLTLSNATGLENVLGTASADTITGNARNNAISGNAGNDAIEGKAGDDVLTGGAGNDTYTFAGAASLGSDTINEGSNLDFDYLYLRYLSGVTNLDLGITSAQVVNASLLTLTLSSGSGIEGVIGTEQAANSMTGNARDNTLQAWGYNDVLNGLAGNDGLYGGDGNNTIAGGDGNDTLRAGSGNDVLTGGAGSDTYELQGSYLGSDNVVEAPNVDGDTLYLRNFTSSVNLDLSTTALQVVSEGRFSLTLSDSTGIENVFGTDYSTNFIRGNARNNSLQSGNYNDTLLGMAGDDSLAALGGNDTLEGGTGNDTLGGLAGNDTYIFSGTSALGNDTISSGWEAANVDSDTFDFSAFGSAISLNLANGSQTYATGSSVGWGSNAIENVIGTQFADTLTGDARSNILTGGSGNDTLTGAAGNDTLTGGAGNDSLTGGAGSDTYQFSVASDFGSDTVTEASSADSDTLKFIDASATALAVSYTSAQNGSVALGSSSVSYTGIEKVDTTGSTLGNLVINLPTGADNAVLEDDGSGGYRLRSTNSTFTPFYFAAPATSLTINGGTGDSLRIDKAISVTGNLVLAVPTIELNANLTAASITGSASTVNILSSLAQIQDGIELAATGATVNVAAGTYVEQLVIVKNLTILGAGETETIISCPSTLVTDSLGNMALVRVGDPSATGTGPTATIEGVKITGPGPGSAGSINFGVWVCGFSTLHFSDSTVASIRDNPHSGVQSGTGIFVGRNLQNQVGTATITNVTITDYQKNGITVDKTGSSAIITDCTVTGAGSTLVTAQNGIQISRGATGSIVDCTVSGNDYIGSNPGAAAGILIYQTDATDFDISGNTFFGNQVDILNGTTITTLTILAHEEEGLGEGLTSGEGGDEEGLSLAGNLLSQSLVIIGPENIVPGSSLTLVADIAMGPHSTSSLDFGTVSFYLDGLLLGTVAVVDNQASLNIAAPAAGDYTITAAFSGSECTEPSEDESPLHVNHKMSFAVSAPPSVNEAAGTLSFSITATGDAGASGSVHYKFIDGSAQAGEDFVFASGVANFTGAGTQSFSVTITNDTVHEQTEDFTIELYGAEGSPGTVVSISDGEAGVDIIDNDPPKMKFSVSAPTTVGEEDGTLEFTITATGDTDAKGSVHYKFVDGEAKSPDDFTFDANVVNFAALGTKTFTVTITDDTLPEDTEDFQIELYGAEPAPETDDAKRTVVSIIDGQADVDILDNDPPIANDDQYATAVDEPITGNVLDNDEGGGDEEPLTATLVSGPAHAALFELYSDGSFTYQPEEGYIGEDSFAYKAVNGDLSSNIATVALASVSGFITPANNQKGSTGDEVPSVLQNGKKHYVSPKAADSSVILKANLQPANQQWDPALFEWHVNGQVANGQQGKPEEIAVSRAQTGKFVVELWNKKGNKAFDTTVVWIVWADTQGPQVGDLNTYYFNVDNQAILTKVILGKLDANGNATDFNEFTAFVISPGSILTDQDRPKLDNPTPAAPPGTAGGVKSNWDISRQERSKLINPNNVDLTRYGGASYTNNTSWPANPLDGNDDSSANDEDDDPYDILQRISAVDAPDAGLNSLDGAVGDTLEYRLQFREFARLEIGGTWYAISNSDGAYWHVTFKFKKVDENAINTDINGDNDKTDIIWKNEGASAAANLEGWGD